MKRAILLVLALVAMLALPAAAQTDGYVVVTDAPVATAQSAGVDVEHVYTEVISGFSATLTPDARDALDAQPGVEVYPDVQVHANQAAPGSWGIDRIDQRSLPLDGSYSPPNAGAGTTVYVVDSGVRISHIEFGGRASHGPSYVNGDPTDENGHGTHVAGTVAGQTVGAAQAASIVSLRVLDAGGSGPVSNTIAALDWIAANRTGPSVVNLSLSVNGVYSPLDQAVAGIVEEGVVAAVAASNDAADACGYSPAREPSAITVASTDAWDVRSWFSNYGSCVDLFAPGQNINSAFHGGDSAYTTKSGTSMAAPHVAGVSAMYLEAHPTAEPAQVEAAIEEGATEGVVTDTRGAPNLLLYADVVGLTPPPDPDPEPEPVDPVFVYLRVTPSILYGGDDAQLIIGFDDPVNEDEVVTLSDDSDALSIPDSATVPEGEQFIRVPVTTTEVSNTERATVTGVHEDVERTTRVTIREPRRSLWERPERPCRIRC